MATRTPSQSSNRQNGSFGNGSGSSSMDVGANAVTRMAREDTRWFIAGVVILSIVLFLALPISMLVVIDYMKMKAEMKTEIRKMKEDIRKVKNAPNSSLDSGKPD